MKTKNYLKSWLLMLALIAGTSMSWAAEDTETIDFPTSSANVDLSSTGVSVNGANVSVSIAKGTGSNLATNTDGTRIYNGNSMVFSSTTKKISKVVFAYKRNKKVTNGVSANSGSFTTEFTVGNSQASGLSATWEASNETTTSVTFTVGSGNGNYALQSAVVTFVEEGGGGSTIYSVTYNGNGNTDGTAPADETEYSSGDEVTVLGNTGNLEKTGYSFDGWNTEADGSGNDYDADDTFTITANTTLYAQWIQDPYTVTLDDDSSTLTEASSGAGVTLPSRDGKAGYSFAGWSETNVPTETTIVPTIIPAGSYTPTGNITLYPVYSKTEGGASTESSNVFRSGSYADPIITWSIDGVVSITQAKGSGNTAPNSSYVSSPRWYTGNKITITPSVSINSISVTTTTEGYATELASSTYTNATANASGTAVTITPTNGSSVITIVMSGQSRLSSLTVNYSGGTTYYWSAPVAAAVETPTFSLAAGTYEGTQNVEISCITQDATIYYTTDGSDPTSSSTLYSGAITIDHSCTLKAIAIKDRESSAVASAYYEILDPNRPGTENNPYTVAQALEADVESGVYVKGIVSAVTEVSTQYHNVTYKISDDGTTSSDQFIVYRGKNVDNSNITSEDDVQVGDVVVVYGNIAEYQGANQLAQGNYLVSLTRPEKPEAGLAYATTEITAERGGVFTAPELTNPNNLNVTYSSSNEAVATVDAETGVVTLHKAGETTITATFDGNSDYKPGSASYSLTVTVPSHTATFFVNGQQTGAGLLVAEDAAITFPATPEAIEGKTFVGWVTETIESETDEAPNFVTSATMGTSDLMFYAVFANKTGGSTTEVIDELTADDFVATGTTYKDFSGVTKNSDAVYAGNSAYNKGSIQLRASDNSGMVSTSSGGQLKKITVEWSGTDVRTLDIYGSDKAYTAASNLYDSSKRGTKLGSIVKGTSTELAINGDYQYIGLRSNDKTIYLDKISITWENGTPATYSGYCTTVSKPVAKIGNKGFATLQAAVDAAEAGQTIDIVDDFTLTTVTTSPNDKYNVNVNKSVTINGNGHVITSAQGKRALALTGEGNKITIKGLTIVNNKADWCMGILNNLTCTLDATTIDGTGYAGSYNQPLTIGAIDGEGRVTLNVTNGSVVKTNDEGTAHYSIIVAHPADITVTDSELIGWATVYLKPDAAGSNVMIDGSEMKSQGLSGNSNNFAILVTEGDNNTIEVKDTKITSSAVEGTYQSLITLGGEGNVVKLLGETIYETNDKTWGAITYNWGSLKNNKLYLDDTTKAAFAEYLDGSHQETIEPADETGLYPVSFEPEVLYYWAVGDSYQGGYYSFADPFKNGWLDNGEFIALQKNITLTEDITCQLGSGTSFNFLLGDFTADKNGHSVSLNTGVTVYTDKQTDIFSAAEEGYAIAETKTETGYSYTAIIPVAKIGDAVFASLADAIAAVPANGTQITIQMIADEEFASDATMTVEAGKNIVLDLNGKTVSGISGVTKSFYFITNNGTLEITDNSENASGKITYKSATADGSYSKEFVTVYNLGGTLTLTKGTVENTSGGGLAYAINNSSNAWGSDVVSTFNMNGGTVSAPSGDAALRVYQNCAAGTVQSKNYVNITGGTIAATGIFVDETLYNNNIPADYAGANIDTKINISGGSVVGLIDMKIRHPFNTLLNITGGDFSGAKMWVRKADGYVTSCGEPTAPMVAISGGKFDFAGENAFGLAYNYAATTWSSYDKPYAISGGVFDLAVPEEYCAENMIPADNTDEATSQAYPYTVSERPKVAQIGDVQYYSLADAVAAVPADGTETTITMIDNEMVNVVGYAITIPSTKNVVIDLNGFQVVGTAGEAGTSALIRNLGTLTIKDSSDTKKDGTGTGKLISGASPTWTWDGTDDYSGSYASNLIRNEKDLIVESGLLYTMSKGSAAYAIDNYSAGNITINGGKVDAAKASAIRMFYVNGGSITVNDGVIGHYNSDEDYSYMGVQVMSGTNVNVSVAGGTIAGFYALYANNTGGSLAISGGTFDGYVGIAAAVPNDILSISGGTFNEWVGTWGDQTKFISGGTYSMKPDAEYIADGYIAAQQGNVYVVIPESDMPSAPTIFHDAGEYEGELTIAMAGQGTINYTINSGETQTYSAPFTISDEGEYTIKAWTELNGITSEESKKFTIVPVMTGATKEGGYYNITTSDGKYVNVAGRKTVTFVDEITAKTAAGTVIRVETNDKGQVAVLRSQGVDLPRYAERAMSYVSELAKEVVNKLAANVDDPIIGEQGVDLILAKFNKEFDYHLYLEEANGGYRIYGRTPSMKPVVDFYAENKDLVDSRLPKVEDFVKEVLQKIVDKMGRGQSVVDMFKIKTVWENMGGTLTDPDVDQAKFFEEVLSSEENTWQFAYQTGMLYWEKVKDYLNENAGDLGDYGKYLEKIPNVQPNSKYYIVPGESGIDFMNQSNVAIVNKEATTIWTMTPCEKFVAKMDVVSEKNIYTTTANETESYTEYYTTLYTDFAYTLPEGVKAYKINGINTKYNTVLKEALKSTTIPAQTPVLLFAQDDEIELTLDTNDGSALSDNTLYGNDWLITKYELNTPQLETIFALLTKLSSSLGEKYEHLKRLNAGTVNNKYFFNLAAPTEEGDFKEDFNNGKIKVLSNGENGIGFYSNYDKNLVGNEAFMFSEGYNPIMLSLIGDVNRDGDISIADVTALVNIILGKAKYPDDLDKYDFDAANVNRDTQISIADVTKLVNIILGKK